MLDLQHQYNNPSHEGGFHTLGAHPRVRGCCAVVVMVKCNNQISKLIHAHTSLVSLECVIMILHFLSQICISRIKV